MFSHFPCLMRSIGGKARIAKAMLFSHYTEYLLRRRENRTGSCRIIMPDRASVHGDFGAASITERSCAAQISKMERHISDRFYALL